MRTLPAHTEKLLRLQAIIWIAEERLVNRLHCLKNLDNPYYQEYFERSENSSMYCRAIENIMYGLQTGEITTGPFG